jgi:hypothetical protein
MNVDYKSMAKKETYVPPHMRGAVIRWIENGIPMGSFGQTLITGDLGAAAERADHINIDHLDTFFNWFVEHAPLGSYGQHSVTDEWKGLQNEQQRKSSRFFD